MKIFQVHNRYRYFGGEDRMYESMVHMLRSRGHEVSVFERSSEDIRGVAGKIGAFFNSVYSRSSEKAFSTMLCPNVRMSFMSITCIR